MSDPTIGLDWTLSPESFEVAYADYLGTKPSVSTNGAGNSTQRATGAWANFVDESLKAAHARGYGIVSAAEFGLRTGNSAADNSTAMATMLSTVPAGTVIVPPPGTYAVNNIQIANRSHVALIGGGATFSLNATGAGIELNGTCENIQISGLRIVGDGQSASTHRGVYSFSGQTLRNIQVTHCDIESVTLGISFNADQGGSVRHCVAAFNYLNNIVGAAIGSYGLHFADGTGQDADIKFIGNTVVATQRHAAYIARGYGALLMGNSFYDHRLGFDDGSALGCVLLARGGRHRVIGNLVVRPHNIGIFLDAGDNLTGNESLVDVVVSENLISDPQNTAFSPSLMRIGENVTPIENIRGIAVTRNLFRSSGYNGSHLTLTWGQNVDISENVFHMEGVTSTTWPVSIAGAGESAGSATWSDNWSIRQNKFRVTDGGGGGSSGAIRLNPPFNNDSSIRLMLADNDVIVPGNKFSTSSSITNQNISIRERVTTGLTFSAGVRPAPSDAVVMVGEALEFATGVAGEIRQGDGLNSKNDIRLVRKPDAANQNVEIWRVGTATSGNRFILQWNSSEQLTWIPCNASGSALGINAFAIFHDSTNGRSSVRWARSYSNLGTSLLTSHFTDPATTGWGSGASLSVRSNSKDQRGSVTVTVGTGPSANPTLVLTYPDGTWGTDPFSIVSRNGGTGTGITGWTWSESATALTITAIGTPVAGETYTLRWALDG